MSFEGKVAVITGAASGIGRALSIALARRGADLAIADLDERGLEETRGAIENLGRRVLAQKLDVADRAGFEAFRDDTLERFGRADIVVNNAGVAVADTILESRY